MGIIEYQGSINLEHYAITHYVGNPFYALLMAAARQADTNNLEKLKYWWPDEINELQARVNAPGGLLPGEKDPDDDIPF